MSDYRPYKWKPIDDLDVNIPKNKRKEALEEAATYIRDSMLDYIGDGRSPVSGGKWVRGLTKEYREKKGEESSSDFANLELSGDMLNSLEVSVDGSSIVVSVGEGQEGKATGHLTGEYGTHSRIRPRVFMPQGDDSFKRDILSGVKKILQEFEE